jgi:transcriptional regulator GlxA family with amidase domain
LSAGDNLVPGDDLMTHGISPPQTSRDIGFLLVDGFALMSYASIIEPFRAANALSRKELYNWRHVSVDGEAVRASNGAYILADAAVGEMLPVDTLFVVAGGDPRTFADRRTFGWLRQLARHNVRLGGVSGGPYILAQAGVLDGYRCTVHWEYSAAFEEYFPRPILETGLYVIDRGRLTCAGGAAGLDMAVELIGRDHGQMLAIQVSEWFIRTQVRAPDGAQRMNLRERYGVRSGPLLRALARMEASIDEPEGRVALARSSGVSLRQLERLFGAHLGCSINQAYMRMRLEHAELLLNRTAMSVSEVSAACGFATPSHFSRRYKARYGRPPSERT